MCVVTVTRSCRRVPLSLSFPLRFAFVLGIAGSGVLSSYEKAHAQLDETWTVTINGRPTQVYPDGSFKITNIPALDNDRDGLSDITYVAQASRSLVGLGTQFACSALPFLIPSNGTVTVGAFQIFPPNISPDCDWAVQSLRIVAPDMPLHLGQQVQLTVFATLSTGADVDATSSADYGSSNPAVIAIGPDGLATASGSGVAVLFATLVGATATKRIEVVSSTVVTAVDGFVQVGDGTPVPNASVTELSTGSNATSDGNGFFSIPLSITVISKNPTISLSAYGSVGGEAFFGSTTGLPLVASGITDAGIITLGPACDLQWGHADFTYQSMYTSQPITDVFGLDYGSGPALYAVGSFKLANGATLSNATAKWDGVDWSQLNITGVNDMTVHDDGTGPALYAAGSFTTAGGTPANRIAKWDGAVWLPLDSGVNGSISTIRSFQGNLYAGGVFTMAGGIPASRIARWNGSVWSVVGTGVSNVAGHQVTTMLEFDPDDAGPTPSALYVGGAFSTAGGITVNHIAKWSGSTWSALGSGFSSDPPLGGVEVRALAGFDPDGAGPTQPSLYAGGSFKRSGATAVDDIARWTGSSWVSVGGSFPEIEEHVSSLLAFDDGSGPALYVGGHLSITNDADHGGIAKWNGTTWSPVGGGMAAPFCGKVCNYARVYALTSFPVNGQVQLFAAGDFLFTDGFAAPGLATWTGQTWLRQGNAMDSPVRSLLVHNDGSEESLYVSGSFRTIAGIESNRIARCGATSCTALNTGMNNTINALHTFDDGAGPSIYAGGTFTQAGSSLANRIAKWNGSDWSALSSGLTGGSTPEAFALTSIDGGSGPILFVGGSFNTAGTTPASNIAQWDADTWSSLLSGTNGPIYALAFFDAGSGPELYAAGSFSMAGGNSANNIARWDGATWSSLTTGTNNTIYALATFNDGSGLGLFVAGTFTTAGGISTNRIAKWDGFSWTPLATGVSGGSVIEVRALASFDDGLGPALFASGSFTNAGSVSALGIARWDGFSWSALPIAVGSGFALVGFDIDASGPNLPALYVGNAGATALNLSPLSNVYSPYLVKWYRPLPPCP